jgi:hypothetical protein
VSPLVTDPPRAIAAAGTFRYVVREVRPRTGDETHRRVCGWDPYYTNVPYQLVLRRSTLRQIQTTTHTYGGTEEEL